MVVDAGHSTDACGSISVNGWLTIVFTGCWASSGYTVEGCGALEQQLRSCMDEKVRN